MSPPYTLMLKLKEGISTRDTCRADMFVDSVLHKYKGEQCGQTACTNFGDEAEHRHVDLRDQQRRHACEDFAAMSTGADTE